MAAVPGAILLLIPPVLVAVTGLFLLPGSFALVHARILAERRHLEGLGLS